METYFKKDRARYMGVWTLLVTLGIPCGPFIFGFVAYRAGYEWIYWVLAIVSNPLIIHAPQRSIPDALCFSTGQRGSIHPVSFLGSRNSLPRQQHRSETTGMAERICPSEADRSDAILVVRIRQATNHGHVSLRDHPGRSVRDGLLFE